MLPQSPPVSHGSRYVFDQSLTCHLGLPDPPRRLSVRLVSTVCRVISGPFAFITPLKPSRDPRRDVPTTLFERVVSDGNDGRSRL